jgi:hypothetical protein
MAGVSGALKMTLLALVAAALTVPAAARAAVEITFYSREYGSHFPHAFVVLTGTLVATGERIEANYGFTATHVSPAILLGSVRGEIISADAAYIAGSEPHFRFTLTDTEYHAVMATVARWGRLPQPSYNLNRQNCVFFVADVAERLGMSVSRPASLMKKPRSYTEHLTRENRAWLERRRATFLRTPGR